MRLWRLALVACALGDAPQQSPPAAVYATQSHCLHHHLGRAVAAEAGATPDGDVEQPSARRLALVSSSLQCADGVRCDAAGGRTNVSSISAGASGSLVRLLAVINIGSEAAPCRGNFRVLLTRDSHRARAHRKQKDGQEEDLDTVTILPRVTSDGAGLIHVHAEIPAIAGPAVEGEWSLSVAIEQQAGEPNVRGCVKLNEQTPGLAPPLNFSVAGRSNLTAFVENRPLCTSPSVPASSMFVGGWYGVQSIPACMASNPKDACTRTWQPSRCVMPSKDAQATLRGKWLLFFGDSTVEESFYNLLYTAFRMSKTCAPMLKIEQDHGHVNVSCDAFRRCGSCCRTDKFSWRNFDTGALGALPNRSRMTHVWIGNRDTCCNNEGLRVFRDGAWLEQTLSMLRARSSAGQEPDVIVLASGLHDIEQAFGSLGCEVSPLNGLPQKQFTFTEFADNLEYAVRSLHARYPHAHFIVKTTNPAFQGYDCNTRHKNNGLPCCNAAIHLVNAIKFLTIERLAREGIRADVLDQWAFRYATPDEGDGHHCKAPPLGWAPSCRWAQDALLALIERGMHAAAVVK